MEQVHTLEKQSETNEMETDPKAKQITSIGNHTRCWEGKLVTTQNSTLLSKKGVVSDS